MSKLISAILTVYNGEKFLAETIESILSQEYENFELIIVNDGSTDNTENVIKKYNDQRIKYYKLVKNLGVGAAICIALEHATGEYIAKVDSDDRYDTKRFLYQIEFLENNRDVDLVDCLIEYFPDNSEVEGSQRYKYIKEIYEDQVNEITTTKDIHKKLYWFCCITHSTIMYRKSLLDTFSYNPNLRGGEDYEFFYKMNQANIKMEKILYTLGNIRVSSTSTTVIENTSILDGVFKIKESEIKNLVNSNRKIYIWGTGELGKITLKTVSAFNIKIQGFIDNDRTKVNSLVNGVVVKNKDSLENNDYILIASTYGKIEISDYLESMGFLHLDDYLVIL